VGEWSGRDATLKVATTHSSETSEIFTRLHGVKFRKTAAFEMRVYECRGA